MSWEASFSEGYRMVALLQKLNLKAKSHQAHQLLACSPREATGEVLELPHGFSRETLANLTRAGLIKLVTETLRIEGGTFTIDRLHMMPLGGRSEVDRT
jgi:hypothetical protein